MIIYAGSINRDHVHMLIGILRFGRPVSEGQEFAQTVIGVWLWARGYWVASSGNVTDEVWKEYIKTQKPGR